MKKGNPIRIEELEVGKAYSQFGGMSYFVVLEKTETSIKVDYPKSGNKTRIQVKEFAKFADRIDAGQRVEYRYQERFSIKPIIISNSIHN